MADKIVRYYDGVNGPFDVRVPEESAEAFAFNVGGNVYDIREDGGPDIPDANSGAEEVVIDETGPVEDDDPILPADPALPSEPRHVAESPAEPVPTVSDPLAPRADGGQAFNG